MQLILIPYSQETLYVSDRSGVGGLQFGFSSTSVTIKEEAEVHFYHYVGITLIIFLFSGLPLYLFPGRGWGRPGSLPGPLLPQLLGHVCGRHELVHGEENKLLNLLCF